MMNFLRDVFSTRKNHSGKTVLMIEDNKILSEMYEYKLRLEGFDVVVANDGKRGIEMALERKPTLILLDIMMPGMSGYEVLERLKGKERTSSKVIVFSNLNDPKDKERCISLGASEFVLKASVTPKELISKISDILR